MTAWAPVELTRDCRATTVPYGVEVQLNAGGQVQLVQRLGSSITVRTEMGSLLRIDGADADALGLEPTGSEQEPADSHSPFALSRVTDALQGVYDPEIPVSIVELGLVYRCDEVPLPGGRRRIEGLRNTCGLHENRAAVLLNAAFHNGQAQPTAGDLAHVLPAVKDLEKIG